MKRVVFVCCLIFSCGLVGNAQLLVGDSTLLKSVVAKRKVNIDESSGALAMYFQSLHKNKYDQLQAAYTWVASHIRYDADSSYYFNNADYETQISGTLRRRKGVCENFAVLFADIANKMDILSYVVHGYAHAATGRNAAHSWVAVSLNNEWYLCDPTWDAGLPVRNNYFLGDGAQFIASHMPFDPIWQLLEKPTAYKRNRNSPTFNYKDSISTFLKSDSLKKFMAIERRMKQMDIDKELFKVWQSYNRMNIVIMAEEENMNLYNDAVGDLNKATVLFNEFVEYRNNRFLPQKSDKEIEHMLTPIHTIIAGARDKLGRIGVIVENFQYNTESLIKRLDNLASRTDEQKFFLKKYLATNISEREKLMYR